ncbi:uncharacterized protein METZ01_LOCUS143087 [marine metagenome]|uniref:DUF2244 domain-containing protein n=1 Tax=marine metagenome TaxID=408172 RepID=A0A381ZNC2_9ZZZZ
MIDLRHQEGTSQTNGILLEACLSPSVAIKLSAVRWILSLFGCVCVLVGVTFALIGAQPVLGFMGIEIILLFAVYRFCVRNSRMAEQIILSGHSLLFRRIDRYGNISITNLEPLWLRVEIGRVKGVFRHIVLASKGRTYNVGVFLTPEEKVVLLNTLQLALRKLRIELGLFSHI